MDILTEMQDFFPNFKINLQEAPSFIQCHLDEPQPHVCLVSLKGNKSPENTALLTPKKQEHTVTFSATSDFELTGSPLKLDMAYEKLDETLLADLSMFWSQDESSLEPLSLEDARNVADYYSSKLAFTPSDEIIPLWVICDTQDSKKTILMATYNQTNLFSRGLVGHLGMIESSKLSIEKLKDTHWNTYGCSKEKPLHCTIVGIYRISGRSAKSSSRKNKLESSNNGLTQLECRWNKYTLQAPMHDTAVKLVQEVIVGHATSNCSILWQSICALQGIRNALLNFTNVVTPNNIAGISIRPFVSTHNIPHEELEARLKELLNEVENYNGLPHGPKGGCICISDDTTNLQQVFKHYMNFGSSNDFTFKLWNILKDANMVEDLINLLVYALKEVYKRNLRPFIDPGNTTLLGSLVKKLARGISQQALKSLSSFRSNPGRALNIIGQLGISKLCWEYTNVFSLIDNALGFNNRLRLQNKVVEINEDVINQTILDMTLGSGDVTVNPSDTKFNLMDSTLVNEPETTFSDNLADLTFDNFASLKKHNIEVKTERKLADKDQPLISADADLDIPSAEWKYKLTRLAQLHVCMEHIYRAQSSLNCDFGTLRPIITQLLDFYTDDKSPIKTVDQVNNDPIQTFSLPIQYKIVKEHLQFKQPTIYRIAFQTDTFKENNNDEPLELSQSIKTTFVYSQQNIFPPSIYSLPDIDIPEGNDIMYHGTKYVHVTNAY